MNRLFKTFGSILLIAVLVSTVLLAQTSALAANKDSANAGSVAQVTNPPTNSITVSGYGTANGKPNIAFITLGTEVPDADPSKALANANDLIAKITEALKAAGIAEEDIQTTNFSVYSRDAGSMPMPSEGQTTPPQMPRTYVAQINVSLKVRDVSKVGAVIDAGVKAGANNIYGLSFGIDDPTALEKDARLKAIENARTRAEELAAALGVTLGDPIIIDESYGGTVIPMGYGGARAEAAANVSEGQLSVAVTVRITYSISK